MKQNLYILDSEECDIKQFQYYIVVSILCMFYNL